MVFLTLWHQFPLSRHRIFNMQSRITNVIFKVSNFKKELNLVPSHKTTSYLALSSSSNTREVINIHTRVVPEVPDLTYR